MNNRLGIAEKFQKSAKELSSPVALAVCAMLLAVSVVLGYFANISITFLGTNLIKIGFTAIPIALAAMLYGPVPAAIIGALTDILCFIIAPMGPYMPGFTISMIVTGVIFGIAYYGEKPSLTRVIISNLINSLLVGIVLGTLWFVLFYNYQVVVALSTRGLKELVMFPINVALIFGALKAAERVPEIKKIRNES